MGEKGTSLAQVHIYWGDDVEFWVPIEPSVQPFLPLRGSSGFLLRSSSKMNHQTALWILHRCRFLPSVGWFREAILPFEATFFASTVNEGREETRLRNALAMEKPEISPIYMNMERSIL